MTMAIDIRDQDFDQQVLKSSLPVVVDFWAPWCDPCGIIASRPPFPPAGSLPDKSAATVEFIDPGSLWPGDLPVPS